MQYRTNMAGKFLTKMLATMIIISIFLVRIPFNYYGALKIKPVDLNNLNQRFGRYENVAANRTTALIMKTATPNNIASMKIVLMWNRKEPLFEVRCPEKSCLFTTDTSLIHQSDVVVLHFDTLEDFPLNRQPHQRFVFYHFESPENTASALMDDPRFRYNYFNWTMTYRRDSDIFMRDYYGSLVVKTSTNFSSRAERYNYTLIQNANNPTANFTHGDNNLEFIKGKTKMIAWFVGNCFTPIRREEYVRQLSQYITVDIFGYCNKECPYNCDDMIRLDYKFYLAFENSWCPDYVTEKFSRPLFYGAIPIVLGGADYSKFAPTNSYINARDFPTAKDLANFLIILNKTDSLYASYFGWKKKFHIMVPDMYGWCELCHMAYNKTLPRKIYHDIKKWWMFDGGKCESDSTKYF